jgi:exopolyphosphatase/guanosine-5'-triphosphate,3'-diphosphate pyrophosphatase
VRLAALDVGTNTIRLLVADVEGGKLVPVGRGREITRLGRGVDATQRLDPEASARSLAVIEEFVARARDLGAERIRIAGTSVLRDARDGDEFSASVRAKTEVPLEILAGADEGLVAFRGATSSLPSGEYVVCDIGGGSTELVRGAAQAEAFISLDIGSVRLKERCLHGDPPTPPQIEVARAVIDDALAEADRTIGVTGSEQLVGVAGTITTLAAIAGGGARYDADVVHHSRVKRDAVVRHSDRLLTMTAAQIRDIEVVEVGRADVIAAGALILRCVMERWGFTDVLVSELDILHGLVLDLADRIA